MLYIIQMSQGSHRYLEMKIHDFSMTFKNQRTKNVHIKLYKLYSSITAIRSIPLYKTEPYPAGVGQPRPPEQSEFLIIYF